MNGTCTGISPNADVSGIGIRVNLYTTTLLLAIIPRIPGLTTPLIEFLEANAGVSGTALIITAIIETAMGRLSLYHAIFIVHMLFFLGFTASPSGRYPPTRALLPRLLLISTLSCLIMLLYIGWSLFVWSTADSFGASPECNHEIKYIFFFASVRATVPWLRGLWITGLAMCAIALVMVPSLVMSLWCCRRKGGIGRGEEVEKIKLGLLSLAAVYDVVMLELYVKRNRHLISQDDEQNWTFGQILALVMVLSSLNEVVHFLIHLYFMITRERDGGDTGSSSSQEGEMRVGDVDVESQRRDGERLQIEERMEMGDGKVEFVPKWLKKKWGNNEKKKQCDEEEVHDTPRRSVNLTTV